MALHPVGPLPAATYWRRRAVLLVGLLVLLLLLRSCAGGSPKKQDSLSTTPKPTATRPVTPKATAPAVAPVTPATAPATGTDVAVCSDAQVALTVSTDADSYGPGATPRITLVVKNTSSTACRRDVGAGAVELQVLSGADRIWSSDDCSPSKAVALQRLSPQGSQAIIKTWPGKRSKPGCTGSQATAQPGTYVVVARVGTLRKSSGSFTIHA